MNRRRLAGLVLALGIAATTPIAHAAQADWSGLDARNFGAPIPAPGKLIASVPLNPDLSVPGAARAFRILYSTVDQHDSCPPAGRPRVAGR